MHFYLLIPVLYIFRYFAYFKISSRVYKEVFRSEITLLELSHIMQILFSVYVQVYTNA